MVSSLGIIGIGARRGRWVPPQIRLGDFIEGGEDALGDSNEDPKDCPISVMGLVSAYHLRLLDASNKCNFLLLNKLYNPTCFPRPCYINRKVRIDIGMRIQANSTTEISLPFR